ncbi:hypothetical protein B0H13DRAFT_1880553 [Mycena leptocephala]|nr:hypothetical protein B0H13DRAFT_1880553 [Mycena leptocephala]
MAGPIHPNLYAFSLLHILLPTNPCTLHSTAPTAAYRTCQNVHKSACQHLYVEAWPISAEAVEVAWATSDPELSSSPGMPSGQHRNLLNIGSKKHALPESDESGLTSFPIKKARL